MKRKVIKLIKIIIDKIIFLLYKTKFGVYFNDRLISSAMNRVLDVTYNNLLFKFAVPNKLCVWRAETFEKKEPETLNWIDQMKEGSIVWDIGANVGLYSIYMAKNKKCKVFAFEPSVFNLELLARNIFLNKLSNVINIVPLAFSDKLGPGNMKMTTTEWGGALAVFNENFGWDGNIFNEVFEFITMGLTMDDAITLLKIPQPEYIKIDVDGLEHFILKGGYNVLKNVKQILIEINDDFKEQADDCRQILENAGLYLIEKKHSEMFTNSSLGFQNSYNQIWKR